MRALLCAAAALAVAACAPHPRPGSSAAPRSTGAPEGDLGAGEDEEATPHHRRPAHATLAPCAADLASCSPDGCEPPGSPHALLNRLKRRETDARGDAVSAERATTITFAQLRELQARADTLFPEHEELTAEQRQRLQDLTLEDGTVLGEGTAVRLVGRVARADGRPSSSAHPGGIESVNCRLRSVKERDVHIPLVAGADDAECDGAVVEAIPQTRADHPRWTSGELRKLATAGRRVMFVGPLFYDNEHLVNADCGRLEEGQPRRMTLWEIHPVIEVYVCEDESCTASSSRGWRGL